MCGNSKGCCKKGSCAVGMIAKILVIVGGVNWGLVGLGMLLGKMGSWNIVHAILGSLPAIEAIVYVLVGVAAVMKIFGCKCHKCDKKEGGSCCAEVKVEEKVQ